MKKGFLFNLFLIIAFASCAQNITGYQSLDAKQPIVFGGSYIVYKGDTVVLGPKAFFIDGKLKKDEVSKFPFVFTSIQEAAQKLTNGTEESPMVLYIAPYVYWIDDPDDPAIRVSKDGLPPYGMTIKCEWLKFFGLTDRAENVILASNRGQTIGAQGNFTMFRFIGQGTASENLTFGNYCNVDLVYPLQPSLNRPKRATAIVQAQLIHCNGDKIIARNTRFISRLNLCPFVGGKRVLFDQCHFESTDDALCGTGVYLNCTLDFYASKPFYNTRGTGAVFLNCDIKSLTGDKQYFTKSNGQVAVVDSRFTTKPNTYVGWQDVVPAETRNYQYNVTINNSPAVIGKNETASTVVMLDKPVLNAYRFVQNGKVIYNTYNLLQGNDDWDPMSIKNVVVSAADESKRSYTKVPVQLLVTPTKVHIETKKNDVTLTAKAMRFGNYPAEAEVVKWSVADEFKNIVQLKVSGDGLKCTVIPVNDNDEAKQVIVTAVTASGLEAASVITVAPSILPAPIFTQSPTISKDNKGLLFLSYKLDTKFKDQSEVKWYRCNDATGGNPIEIAVSRLNTPLNNYTLTVGDVGYYIMASVTPKHIRSVKGDAANFVMKRSISAKDVKSMGKTLITDFKNISTKNQHEVIPGFWTWKHFEPVNNEQKYTTNKDNDAWYYGEGSEGAANINGLMQVRSATMGYTPVGESFGDMKLFMTVAPFKSAGQGFSVAHLYMDVLIKFDIKTMTGYALRFIRTTKFHNAVDCILVKYENGQVSNLSEPVTTTGFRTPCTITIEVKGDKLTAHTKTTAQYNTEAMSPNVSGEVNLQATISPNKLGGAGIQYNGGSPTLIKNMQIDWK